MRALLTILMLALVMVLAPVAHSQWNPQTVDNSGNVGNGTSIAYDSQGNPHMAYQAGIYVRYAYWNGSSWRVEDLAYLGNRYNPSIVIDSLDIPHIMCNYGGTLYYYTRVAQGNWPVSSFAAGFESHHPSVILVNDVPHVAYWANSQLRYAYKDGASWPITVVDMGTSIGQYPSLQIDDSGRIYIAYYDGGGTDLKFAYRNLSGTWATFVVDGVGTNVGQYCSLVLDQANTPHICYYDATNRQLKHATITSLP